MDALDHDPRAVFNDPEIYDALDSIATSIEARDLDALLAVAHPDVHKLDFPQEALRAVLDQLPPGELSVSHFYSEERVGQGDFEGKPLYTGYFDVEADVKAGLLVIAVVREQGACCVFTYLYAEPSAQKPSVRNAFSLSSKSVKHYVVFALLVAVPAFIAVTLGFAMFDKQLRRKYLWIAFIAVGVWGIQFNWTTGALAFELVQYDAQSGNWNVALFKFHLLGASVFKSALFAPWILTVGTPLGAIWYWVKRARRSSPPAPPLEEGPQPPIGQEGAA